MLVESYSEKVVEVSEGFKFDTVDFGVKNPAFIFDMLCNKMYQKPLQTMVQEYMSNARDAHREIGKSDPIEVTLPTTLDQHLRIRDYGPGIDEARMQNVFVFLGESTKRADNLQTGGFGVGAKVGWAYSDSFTVHSTVQGITRSYLAYLGDDNVGKLSLLNTVTAEEADGVEIQVAINDSDLREVERAVRLIAFFWETPPVVNNTRYYEHVPYSSTIDDVVLTDVPFMAGGEYIAVCDGIPYEIDKNEISERNLFKMPAYTDKSACFFFDVGEVEVAPNREGLRYEEKTNGAIVNKMKSILLTEESRRFEIACAFTFQEKLAAVSNYFNSLFTSNDFDSHVLQDVLTIDSSWTAPDATTMRFCAQTARRGRKIVRLDNWHIKAYDLRVDDELVSGITSSCVADNKSGTIRVNAKTIKWVCKASGMPNKDKVRTLFNGDGTKRLIKVIVVDNDYALNQLTSVGFEDLDKVEETLLPKGTGARAPVVYYTDTTVKEVENRRHTREISDLDPKKHCYCTFKEREDTKYNIRNHRCPYTAYYVTQEQLPEVSKILKHATVVVDETISKAVIRAYANADVARNNTDVTESSNYEHKDSSVSKLCQFLLSNSCAHKEPLLSELYMYMKEYVYYKTLYSVLDSSRHSTSKRKYTRNHAAKKRHYYATHVSAISQEILDKYSIMAFLDVYAFGNRNRRVKLYEVLSTFCNGLFNKSSI